MSTSTTSQRSSYARVLRSAVAVTALMIGTAAVHAADPVPPAPKQVENSNRDISNNESLIANQKKTQNAPSPEDTAKNGGGKAGSDTWITTKVKSELLANSASKGLKVNVTTKGGVVALKGKLATQDSVDLVKSIAQNVSGVQSVDVSGLTVDSSAR